MSKLKDLERKLAELQKDNADIGAYSAYGEVMGEILQLLKERDSNETKDLGNYASDKGKRISKLDGNDLEVQNLNLKSGKLSIDFFNENGNNLSIGNRSIEILDKFDNAFYLDGLINRSRFVVGGNYTVKAIFNEQEKSRKITVDGDVYLQFLFKE
jgi:hypothetical protein